MSLTPDEIRALRDAGRGEYPNWEPYTDLCDTALVLYERNEKLEAVVRALAESDPTTFAGLGDIPWCGLCDAMQPDAHAPSCPWRQARELTEGAG